MTKYEVMAFEKIGWCEEYLSQLDRLISLADSVIEQSNEPLSLLEHFLKFFGPSYLEAYFFKAYYTARARKETVFADALQDAFDLLIVSLSKLNGFNYVAKDEYADFSRKLGKVEGTFDTLRMQGNTRASSIFDAYLRDDLEWVGTVLKKLCEDLYPTNDKPSDPNESEYEEYEEIDENDISPILDEEPYCIFDNSSIECGEPGDVFVVNLEE